MEKLVDKLKKKYEFRATDKPLGEGFEARVYRLNKDLAVKIPLSHKRNGSFLSFDDDKTSTIFNEYFNHKGFYLLFEGNEKVNIVKPHGIYAIKNLDDGEYYPGFVMDYLNGKSLKEIPCCKEKKFFSSAVKQWMIIHELGINPTELDFENTLWVPEKEKVYLIDLSGWKFMKGKQFKKFEDFFDVYKKYLKKE